MKKFSCSLFFLVISIFLFSTSYLVGSHVDTNGMLVEPAFFCLPLGYLSLFVSLLVLIGGLAKERLIKYLSK